MTLTEVFCFHAVVLFVFETLGFPVKGSWYLVGCAIGAWWSR